VNDEAPKQEFEVIAELQDISVPIIQRTPTEFDTSYLDHVPRLGTFTATVHFNDAMSEATEGLRQVFEQLAAAAQEFNDSTRQVNKLAAAIEAHNQSLWREAPRRLKKALGKINSGYGHTTWREREKMRAWIARGDRAWKRFSDLVAADPTSTWTPPDVAVLHGAPRRPVVAKS
jgi:hypothetical protein